MKVFPQIEVSEQQIKTAIATVREYKSEIAG
jgi:hypothetical protein